MRKVEVFSAGCPACKEVINLVNSLACSNCEVTILDMNQGDVAQRAKELGVARVPAVVIDGSLAECCQVKGPTEESLKAAGIGQK